MLIFYIIHPLALSTLPHIPLILTNVCVEFPSNPSLPTLLICCISLLFICLFLRETFIGLGFVYARPFERLSVCPSVRNASLVQAMSPRILLSFGQKNLFNNLCFVRAISLIVETPCLFVVLAKTFPLCNVRFFQNIEF